MLHLLQHQLQILMEILMEFMVNAACGALGYAMSDAEYADKVVAITDNLVPYPACPIEISQIYVDYVVKVDSIGNPAGIVSGTTKITKDPVGLKIAKMATKVIEAIWTC